MKNLKDLRKLTREKLKSQGKDLEKEITMETFFIHSKKNNKTAQLRGLKKDLARIQTVLFELSVITSPTVTLTEENEQK